LKTTKRVVILAAAPLSQRLVTACVHTKTCLSTETALIEAKVAEIAQFSELGEFLKLPIRTYSSDMILRLFFSIATGIHGDILLMDEWNDAGDEVFVKKANERLQSLVDRAHVRVIGSHSRDLLSRLSTRRLLPAAGRVVCDGSLDDAFHAYAPVAPPPAQRVPQTVAGRLERSSARVSLKSSWRVIIPGIRQLAFVPRGNLRHFAQLGAIETWNRSRLEE
jgi:ABC-type multidrug transport system ATPase subunit